MVLEPILAAHDWLDHLADLAFDCTDAGAGEAADLVREAHGLIAAAPALWRGQFPQLPSLSAIEALLAQGSDLAAVLAMIENHAGYMLSHAPGGTHLATVVFDGLTDEASSEGASAALALLGAMAAAMAGPALDAEGNALSLAAAADLRIN